MRLFAAPVLASLLASAFLAACGGGAESATPSTGPSRGSYSVTLRSGQPVSIAQESLTLQLTAVSDSRCPIDAVCVWAGHGSVTVQVAQTGQPAETLQIGLPAPADSKLPGEASYRGYRLSLQVLDPAPRAASPTPLDQYRATVQVDKAP